MDKPSCCGPVRERKDTAPRPQIRTDAGESGGDQADIVHVPGGTSFVGTNTPLYLDDGEGPARKTRVAPFRMDAATVTNERFAAFVDATGYLTVAERLGNSLVFQGLLPPGTPPTRAVAEVPWWREVPGASWRRPFGPGGPESEPDHPVVHVSWNDARAFAHWAGGRLPTEAEWEHAARGGLGDVKFPWGDREPDDRDFQPCNIWQGFFPKQDLALDGYAGTAPARSYEPNGYGLFNMIGNVWEMTSDPFKVRSLKKSVAKANVNRKAFKLSKGGSFLCHRSYCYRYRIAARNSTSANSSMSHLGVRLVYD